MVELKTVEFSLQLSYLLPVRSQARVMTVQLPHDLFDDELRVSTDIKPLNPKLGSDAQTVDQRLLFYHVVGGVEV
jgi:hypothetical protein